MAPGKRWIVEDKDGRLKMMSQPTFAHQEPILSYDEEGDVMYIFFRPGESAMGVHLTEHIVLHFQPRTKTPIGLMLLNFSLLVQPTEAGPRSFPLTDVDELPDELKEIVLELLTTSPVDHFLEVSLYVSETGRRIPLVHLETSAFGVPA